MFVEMLDQHVNQWLESWYHVPVIVSQTLLEMLWYIDFGIVAANLFQHCYWNLETSHYYKVKYNFKR